MVDLRDTRAMPEKIIARFDALEQKIDARFDNLMEAILDLNAARAEATRLLVALSERVAVLEAQRH
jgi:hypothetical protein